MLYFRFTKNLSICTR